MDLQDYRKQIDAVDAEITRLFIERMNISTGIAAYKRENGLSVLDASREREKINKVVETVPEELREYTASLYSLLFALSRSYQAAQSGTESALRRKIDEAMEKTPQLFPTDAVVACQGVAGAYSQLACDKLFKRANIFYFSDFEGVFSAIERGLCHYGIIPLENSTAGSVNAVYDLMQQHRFYIVRSVRLKVDHNLLVKKGTKKEDIRAIYSHEQAISQCAHYLEQFPNARIIPCENTAVAAKRVAESDEVAAALSSRACSGLYGLECLESSVQDRDNNFTRFICISKDLEIYPGADRTSLMAVLPHEPGSLYKMLSRFYALGLNLNKLESRPLAARNFEFAFYFDLEASVYAPQLRSLMGELDTQCEQFSYFGSYSEVI